MKDPMTSLEDEVARLTEAALKKVIPRLPKLVPNETICAAVLYGAPALWATGLAVRTEAEIMGAKTDWQRSLQLKESLDDDLRALYSEYPEPPLEAFRVAAAGWNHLGLEERRFKALNRLLTKRFDAECRLRDRGDLVDREVRRTAVERGLVEGLLRVKRAGLLAGPPFSTSVLLGVQFTEMEDPDLVERASARLNDPSWHAEVRTWCEYERACARVSASEAG